jgi:hypothetical protein
MKCLKQSGASETLMYIFLSTSILVGTGVAIKGYAGELDSKTKSVLENFQKAP